jgi:hypothetical protein
MDSLLPKSRVCTKCGEEKLLEEFYKQAKGKYGKAYQCKLCFKQYRQDNKEKIAEYSKQYREANKEKLAEKGKRYHEENKEKIAEKGKRYRKDNKEKIAEWNKRYHEENKEQKKQYYEANRERLVEKRKQYRETNKEKIIERQTEKTKKIKYLIENGLLPKSKVCTKCGEEKLLEEFTNTKKGKYGKAGECKLCRKKYGKQYREANKEKLAERGKQYRKDNKEKIAEKGKRYYEENKEHYKHYHEANKEKRNEQTKQYYDKNKEHILNKGKQYSQDNREKINKRQRNRHKNDEQFRIRSNLSSGLNEALKNVGKTKNASTLTYIGCTIEFMQEHLNSTKKPEWGDDLHKDHIIPQSLFDHTNEEEVKKCWNWRNLRYLPAEENIIKGDTLDMDLVKSYGIEDLLPLEQKLRDGN